MLSVARGILFAPRRDYVLLKRISVSRAQGLCTVFYRYFFSLVRILARCLFLSRWESPEDCLLFFLRPATIFFAAKQKNTQTLALNKKKVDTKPKKNLRSPLFFRSEFYSPSQQPYHRQQNNNNMSHRCGGVGGFGPTGANQTPNPFFFNILNPFSDAKSSLPSSMQDALGIIGNAMMGQAGSFASWVVRLYILITLCIMLLLWAYSVMVYHQGVLRAVRASLFQKPYRNPIFALASVLAVVCLSIALTPVVSMLWPVWLPSVFLGASWWLLASGLQLSWTLVWDHILLNGYAFVIRPIVWKLWNGVCWFFRRFCIWGRWRSATKTSSTERDKNGIATVDRNHPISPPHEQNQWTQLGENLQEVHAQCAKNAEEDAKRRTQPYDIAQDSDGERSVRTKSGPA